MTQIGRNEPFPSRDKIVKPTDKATDIFTIWNEQSLLQRLNDTPVQAEPTTEILALAASDAVVIATGQAAGSYRVMVYREVVSAGGASGLAATLTWSHNGKAMARLLTAFSGSPQSLTDSVGDVEFIVIDAGTPIGCSLVYSGAGASFYVALSAELLQTLGN